MFSVKNACVSRVLPWHRRVMKWVYLWLLLVGCMLIPRKAACARDEKVEHFPAGTRGSGDDSAPPESREDSAPSGATAAAPLLGDKPTASEVYSHLMSLRSAFIRAGLGSANGVPPYDNTIVEGREAVAGHVSLATLSQQEEFRREARPYEMEEVQKHHGMLLDREWVTMLSAATARTRLYMFMRAGFSWILAADDGQRYGFQITPLESDMTVDRFRAADLLRKTKATTEIAAVFGVESLSDVESNFGFLVTHDFLTHPSKHPHVSFPGGSILNFIHLWRETAISLWTLARMMESRSRSSLAMKNMAQIARFNLTLQLMLLIGRITHHGVTLERFNASQILLDEHGNAFFMPYEEPRRQESQASFVSENTVGWPSHDPLTNAMDLGRAMLYLWCPAEASEVSIYQTSPRVGDVLAVVEQCRSIPDDVRHIIILIFSDRTRADSLLHSDIFENLRLRLRQLVEERGARE